MAILSTLRSLALRLWYHFSGSQPVTTESPVSLTELNDDCLLLILGHFSIPQLFPLRFISSRLYFLIQRYHLSRCRALIYGYGRVKSNNFWTFLGFFKAPETTVQVYFSNHQHVYSDYCQQNELVKEDRTFIPTLEEQPEPLQLHSMPLSLPLLLSGLTCLTWTHFLADHVQLQTNEQIVVNRLLVAYLRSSWSTSLVSLHLHLNVPSIWLKPQANHAYFCQLGQLTQLKHLFIEFTQFVPQVLSGALLPDSMPILSQLVSFSLHFYGGSNTAKLLAQLGPNLAFLSLFDVACSAQDYASFLRSKPTYRRTLKRIEVRLHRSVEYQIFAAAAECLSSLERFFVLFKSPEVDFLTILTALSRLSKLREFFHVPLYIDQLRDLRMRNPRLGALPRLPTINRAIIYITNVNPSTFQPEELFDDLLLLLPEAFCGLEHLKIVFFLSQLSADLNPVLSQRLAYRALELFPKLRHCEASYYV